MTPDAPRTEAGRRLLDHEHPQPDPEVEPSNFDVERLAEQMWEARDMWRDPSKPGNLQPLARRLLRENAELRRTARWLIDTRMADIEAATPADSLDVEREELARDEIVAALQEAAEEEARVWTSDTRPVVGTWGDRVVEALARHGLVVIRVRSPEGDES